MSKNIFPRNNTLKSYFNNNNITADPYILEHHFHGSQFIEQNVDHIFQ